MNILKATEPAACALNLAALEGLSKRPALFEPSPEIFWKDPSIAQQLLAMHLDPGVDRASRMPETIKKSACWIASVAGNRGALLDLGCGPGLYCEEFKRLGFEVTGIDFSAGSIAYAREHAAGQKHDIEYICRDYLTMEYEKRFDVIVMIFGDFCVLSDEKRRILLDKVFRALKKEGFFFFDVTTPCLEKSPPRNWQAISGRGFWHDEPHLVLEECIEYPEEHVFLNRYHVIHETGQVKTYLIWNRNYTAAGLERILAAEQFVIDGFYSDLTGNPYKPESAWMGIVARKKAE